MASAEKYEGFTAGQLATEAAFIAWVKCPNETNAFYWKEYVNRYPAQAETVDKARIIVNEMHITKYVMDESRAISTWEKIHKEVNRKAHVPIRPVAIMNWRAAAAILIILFGAAGYFLFFDKPVDKIAGTEKSIIVIPENDIAPGNDKAILTLADGSTIVLDSNAKGAITKQGNVTVINLEGELAYNKEGIATDAILYNTITTPRGGQYQLLLADGSEVWLNAGSSLTYPVAFAGNERKVSITGEAYFEVNSLTTSVGGRKIPFIVKKGEMEVTVLGTHFNVNAYEDENSIKITLLEGAVKVSSGSLSELLRPGQQAQINSDITVTNNVDVETVMAWKNGIFQFNRTDIASIMRQMARWYDVEVVYENNEMKDKEFTGGIGRKENASEVLNMLEMTGTIHFKIEKKRIVVMK